MEFQDFGISLFSLRLGFWGPGPVMTLVWYSLATTAAAMCHSLLPTMYQTRERERERERERKREREREGIGSIFLQLYETRLSM